jgi:hypothetical protein
MTGVLILALIVLVGPLSVLYGTDSRVDDRSDGWPARRSASRR